MKSSHPFQRKILDFILEERLIEAGDHILAAVSGGPDSVALLHVLTSLRRTLGGIRLTVLHFDHRLRGEDSDADKDYVELLAERFGLPFRCESEDVRAYQRLHHLSLEMAARQCRHRFFRDALTRCSAQRIALGHTANDQAEEILLRLLRGTGSSGLAGMPAKSAQGIIRPLLGVTRREILDYLQNFELSFREDASNLDTFCQRNALRLEVFPLFEKHFHPAVAETLARHAGLAQEEEHYWTLELRKYWPFICIEDTSCRVTLILHKLLYLHPAMRRRILRLAIETLRGNLLGIYAVHIELLMKWISEERNRSEAWKALDLPGKLRVAKTGDTLVFFKEQCTSMQEGLEISPSGTQPGLPAQRPARPGEKIPSPALFQVVEAPGSYAFPYLQVRLDLRLIESPTVPADVPPQAASPDIARLDADALHWPLIVRTRQPGDRFQPLGMSGSKKLQDFFIDSKISLPQRDRIILLCDQEKICWVAGWRLDERVKTTPRTKRILIVEKHTMSTSNYLF